MGSGKIVGYARVSSLDQNLDRQLEALGQVDKLFTEKVSGKSVKNRPELLAALDYLREGDTLRVKSLDRLARSTSELERLVVQLKDAGVVVEFVDNPALNTDTPQGAFMMTVLSAVAQLEREMIRERQAEGIALAKAKGTYERVPKITPEQLAGARERLAAGVPKAAVARELGVSRSTLYEALAGRGRYAEVNAEQSA